MQHNQRICPCLWFNDCSEEAVSFYMTVFKNAKILQTTHYSDVGKEFHGREPGSVMTIAFELNGNRFTALNGGPLFKFNEAISLEVHCQTQDEIDHYWEKLSAGGDPNAQACGWLKDKFGVSWQIVPIAMIDMISDHKSPGYARAMAAMFKMKKLDIATLERAYKG